jgi:hypothetical protein
MITPEQGAEIHNLERKISKSIEHLQDTILFINDDNEDFLDALASVTHLASAYMQLMRKVHSKK